MAFLGQAQRADAAAEARADDQPVEVVLECRIPHGRAAARLPAVQDASGRAGCSASAREHTCLARAPQAARGANARSEPTHTARGAKRATPSGEPTRAAALPRREAS